MAIGVCKKLDEYCVLDMGGGGRKDAGGRAREREGGREGEGAEGRKKDAGGRESSIVHPASIIRPILRTKLVAIFFSAML